jgi:Flp pilus assembly pilin Flp
MILDWRQRETRGQTQREVVLVIVVCAIALIAMLSVFIPGLRHFWLGLGRMILRQ